MPKHPKPKGNGGMPSGLPPPSAMTHQKNRATKADSFEREMEVLRLLQKGYSRADIVAVMSKQWQVSGSQAYRIIRSAEQRAGRDRATLNTQHALLNNQLDECFRWAIANDHPALVGDIALCKLKHLEMGENEPIMPKPKKTQASSISYSMLYPRLKATNHLNSPIAKKSLVYLKGRESREFFAKTFFPHYCQSPFSSMHHAMFTAAGDGTQRGRREAIAAPKGNAKTTIMVLIATLHAIVYQTESYILIVSQTASEAKERVTAIANELRDNPYLHAVFGELLGRSIRPGKKASFETTTGIKVEAVSVGQSPRGRLSKGNRPSLVICDDMESLAAAYSGEQREKLAEWFCKDLMKVGQADGNLNVVVVGTVLHPNSLLNELLSHPGWNGQRYRAVLKEAVNTQLWDDYRSILTNLENPHRDAEADEFYRSRQAQMDAGAQVLWPEKESYLNLMKMRILEGEAAFLSEKQNHPFNTERMLFDMAHAQHCDVDPLKQMVSWQEQCISTRELTLMAYHDPSGGKTTGDYAAIVVVGKSKQGRFFVLDAIVDRLPYDQQIEAAYSLQQRWEFNTLVLESVATQNLFTPLYKNSTHAGTQTLTIIEQKVTVNKALRIATLQPYIANGQLIFAKSLPPILIEQLTLYPTDSHDDGPDALQGAVQYLESQSEFTSHGFHAPNPLKNAGSRIATRPMNLRKDR